MLYGKFVLLEDSIKLNRKTIIEKLEKIFEENKYKNYSDEDLANMIRDLNYHAQEMINAMKAMGLIL